MNRTEYDTYVNEFSSQASLVGHNLSTDFMEPGSRWRLLYIIQSQFENDGRDHVNEMITEAT